MKIFFFNRTRAILIMEYAEGGDLDKKIKDQMLIGPFKEEKIITWFLELCQVIKYLHQDHHVLHRDLKPQNIFLTIDNHIKLGDFGISKVLNSSRDLASTPIGTIYYMSPESVKGCTYSYSSDIWSLGIILYELCLLKNPLIHLKSTKEIILFIVQGNFEELIKKVREKNYSKRTCDLIQQILVKDPNKRPTIDKIIQECLNILYDLKNNNIHNNNQLLYSLVVFNSQINLNPLIESKKDRNIFLPNIENKNNNNLFRKKLPPIKVESPYEDFDKSTNEKRIREALDKIKKEGFQVFTKINKNIKFNPSHIKYRESYYVYDNEKWNEKKVDKIWGRQIGSAYNRKGKSTSKKIQDNEYKYSKLLTIDKNTSIELEDNNFHKSKNNIEDKSAAILPMNFTQAGFNPRKNKYTNNNWSKNNQEEYKNKGDNKNEEPGKKNDDNDDEFYLFTYYKN